VGQVTIRRMTEEDLARVSEIEHDLFSLPWSRTSFLFEVNDSRTSYPISALEDGNLVGYAVGWFVADELHIGNVAVARASQGNGIGRVLLEHLLKEAAVRNAIYVTLEVRAGNVRAIHLYREHGFKGIAIRKHYYTDNGEDALVMMAEVGSDTGAGNGSGGGEAPQQKTPAGREDDRMHGGTGGRGQGDGR
jgi:[ribosomal protein S18]-alanine N-acetyltransferase